MMALLLPLAPESPVRRLFPDSDDEEMMPSTGPCDSDCDSPPSYPRIELAGVYSRSSSTGSLPPNNYYLK